MNRMFGLLSGMLANSENSARAGCAGMGDTVKPFARHCRNSVRYEGCLWAGGPARDDPPAVGIAVSHHGSGTTASSHPFLIEAASVPRAFWSGADAGFSASLRSPGSLPRGEFCVGTEPHIDADHDRGRGFHRRRALFRARGADSDHARVPAHLSAQPGCRMAATSPVG